ncbi:MAG: serine hydrolase, partial [Pirellulaceae bacterium]
FAPAGMSHTRFTGDPVPGDVLVAIGRSETLGPPRTALEHPYGSYGFQYRGMGGIVSNVQDLWNWDRAMAANEIVSDETYAEMAQPGLGNYGLGMYAFRNHHGQIYHGHGGKVRGFKCKLRRYPEHDGCLILLSNRDNAVPDIVCDYVETVLFADGDPSLLIPRRLTDDQFEKFEGTYSCDDIGLEIEIQRDGELIICRLRMPSRPDSPASPLYIGTNEAGQYVVLAEQIHDLPVEESEDGKIREIVFINRVFTRK